MANDESTRDEGERQLPEGIEQFKSVARKSQGDSTAPDLQPRRGLPGKGFDAGTGYGGAGMSGAYSGKSSYGGQAGYGGSRTNGAYSDGKYGRDQTHMHAAGDGEHPIEGKIVDEGSEDAGKADEGKEA
jgi:hypothetical protein